MAPGGTWKGLKQLPSFSLDSVKSMTTVPNLEAGKTADNDNSGEECQPAEIKDRNLLHSAAEGGDVSIIEMMLSLGFDVNSKDSLGGTPLYLAAGNGKKQAVDFLLTKGADPSLKTVTERNLLFAAAIGGDVSIVETVLSLDIGMDIDSRDYDGRTPLMCAAEVAKVQAVNYLLDKGANPTLTTNSGWSLLHCACEGGDTTIIKKILSCGLDVNIIDTSGEVTPLNAAIAYNNLEAVKFLLKEGADPGILPVSSLHLAAVHSLSTSHIVSIIEAILASGFNINRRTDTGKTALMYAACKVKPEVVDFLLLKGADPSLRDNSGKTVLHHAAREGDITVIEKCLSCGLDIESKDREGYTPLMLAASGGKTEAVKFLLQRSLNNQEV